MDYIYNTLIYIFNTLSRPPRYIFSTFLSVLLDRAAR